MTVETSIFEKLRMELARAIDRFGPPEVLYVSLRVWSDLAIGWSRA